MKWMKFNAKSGNQIIIEKSNIDHIIIDPETRSGSLKLRNGDRYDIIDDCIWNRLVMTEEKTKLNSMYGVMAARPMPDWDPEILRKELIKVGERYWQAERDLQNRDDEIQDLKLENDRLQKRNDLMENAMQSIACTTPFCDDCMLVDNEECGKLSVKMDFAKDILRKIGDL